MNKMKVMVTSIACILASGVMSSSFAGGCNATDPCDVTLSNSTTNSTHNVIKNEITTNFTPASAASALALKSVYTTVGSFNQSNRGDIYANGNHDQVITTGKGNVSIDVTAIGNNFSSDLVGLKNVNLTLSQKNTGDVTAINTVQHPYVGGNLEITTTAIGNNASVSWDLTTDKTPSNDAFAVKRDGAIRSFDNVGTFVGSIAQCNTGNISAITTYAQDPAANIKVSTTAIGNNMSFGLKTR